MTFQINAQQVSVTDYVNDKTQELVDELVKLSVHAQMAGDWHGSASALEAAGRLIMNLATIQTMLP